MPGISRYFHRYYGCVEHGYTVLHAAVARLSVVYSYPVTFVLYIHIFASRAVCCTRSLTGASLIAAAIGALALSYHTNPPPSSSNNQSSSVRPCVCGSPLLPSVGKGTWGMEGIVPSVPSFSSTAVVTSLPPPAYRAPLLFTVFYDLIRSSRRPLDPSMSTWPKRRIKVNLNNPPKFSLIGITLRERTLLLLLLLLLPALPPRASRIL